MRHSYLKVRALGLLLLSYLALPAAAGEPPRTPTALISKAA